MKYRYTFHHEREPHSSFECDHAIPHIALGNILRVQSQDHSPVTSECPVIKRIEILLIPDGDGDVQKCKVDVYFSE